MEKTTNKTTNEKMKKNIQNTTLSAMFMALGIVLPFFTGQIPKIGNMLLPMHIPILLCGLICGWQYGLAVGLITPMLRHVLFGMPPLPTAIAMAFELAAYGGIVGFLYGHSKWKCIFSLYRSLLVAMVGGRMVWAVVRIIMIGVADVPFSLEMFVSGAFMTAIPGIILQLVLIPAIMVALDKAKLVPFSKKRQVQTD